MKKHLLFLLLLITCGSLPAQMFHFSRPAATPMAYNPAFAGSLDSPRLNVASRRILDDPLVGTQYNYLAYDQFSNRLRGGIGVEAWHTSTWRDDRLALAGMYAGKIPLGPKWTLTPAAKIGARYGKVSGLWYLPNGETYQEQVLTLNLMPGFLLNSPNAYVGIAIDDLVWLRIRNRSVSRYYEPAYTTLIVQAGYMFSPYKDAPWDLSVSGMATHGDGAEIVQAQSRFRYRAASVGAGMSYGHNFLGDHGWHFQESFFSLGWQTDQFRLWATFSRGKLAYNWVKVSTLELSASFYFPHRQSASQTAEI